MAGFARYNDNKTVEVFLFILNKTHAQVYIRNRFALLLFTDSMII